MKVSIGADDEQHAVGAGRDDRLLHQHLQAVGERLQQAERADHVGALRSWIDGQHLALGIGQVGDADQQRHQRRRAPRSRIRIAGRASIV